MITKWTLITGWTVTTAWTVTTGWTVTMGWTVMTEQIVNDGVDCESDKLYLHSKVLTLRVMIYRNQYCILCGSQNNVHM